MVCFRYIIECTLHKGDNNDDDDYNYNDIQLPTIDLILLESMKRLFI